MRPLGRRLSLLAIALAAALAGTDLYVGTQIEEGRWNGIHIPPYGVLDDRTVAGLERRAREARVRKGPGKQPLRQFSTRYGWVNLPGETLVDGRTHRVNALGARGSAPTPEAPPPEGIRVLCCGESFTYCSEVADGEDWPAVLETLDERLEVLNFGVGAWGTDQALLRFRDLAPRLKPDVAILGLLLENVCRNVNRYRQLYQPGDALALAKPRFRLSGGELELIPLPYPDEASFYEAAAAGRLKEELSEFEWWAGDAPLIPFSNLARVWSAKRANTRRMPWVWWTSPDEEPFRVTMALLEAFHREALAAGARAALIVVFESAADHNVVDARGRGTYWGALHDGLEARGVPYVDTFATIDSMLAEGEEAYLATHHTPEANRRIAEVVFRHLRGELPELGEDR